MSGFFSKLLSITALLSILLSACSLPGAGPAATEPAFEDAAIDLPPADFVAIYDEKVASGEWTEGQGLVTLLQVFAGEVAAEQAGVDTSTLIENEGTGILSLAIEYLENGADEAAKAEILRLVNLLVPAQENLLLYSQEDTGQLATQKGAVPPAVQAPDCAALWAGGFPDTRTPSFPCFLANTQNIGGSTYQVFFPAAWAGDDSKRHYYDLTRQAIADTVPVFQGLGQLRSIYFVFNYLGHRDGSLNALAATHTSDFRPQSEACPIVIYPLSLTKADPLYLQTIAHEIFHCFTAFNLRDQFLGARYASSGWWVEGAAEYFSNVVYPAADTEYGFLGAFNSLSNSRALVDMKYENFIFFQFLGNHFGPEGVLQFLRAMPTSPGRNRQLEALSLYPNMPVLFDEFVRQFIDNRIADTSGAIKPYTTEYMDIGVISTAQNQPVDYKSFVPRRYKVAFERGNSYSIIQTAPPSDSRTQFRLALAPGFWQPLPVSANAGCTRLEYVFYFTGVGPMEDVRTTAINISTESSVCTAGCLVGTWELDNEVYKLYLKSFLTSTGTGNPIIQWVEGQALVTFDDTGNTAAEYRDFTVQMFLHSTENILDEAITPEMRVSMNGGTTATYSATETTIATTRSTTNLQFDVRVFVAGSRVDVPVSIPFDAETFSGGSAGGTTQYLCQEGILIVKTAAPGNPALVYHRLSP